MSYSFVDSLSCLQRLSFPFRAPVRISVPSRQREQPDGSERLLEIMPKPNSHAHLQSDLSRGPTWLQITIAAAKQVAEVCDRGLQTSAGADLSASDGHRQGEGDEKPMGRTRHFPDAAQSRHYHQVLQVPSDFWVDQWNFLKRGMKRSSLPYSSLSS
jgi:hypothetical protein